ncbi:DUF6301 family protein [Rhodococcus sp. NPDC057135]|uniref:DUF6301 family protein n=1 Tax=Rhodococcus sp. NPDC057135 TaxID=3346028 RepID=UPI00362F9535
MRHLPHCWGQPRSAKPAPKAALRWDLPKAVISLNLSVSAIYLDLKSPGYQAWMDEPEPEPEYEDED